MKENMTFLKSEIFTGCRRVACCDSDLNISAPNTNPLGTEMWLKYLLSSRFKKEEEDESDFSGQVYNGFL